MKSFLKQFLGPGISADLRLVLSASSTLARAIRRRVFSRQRHGEVRAQQLRLHLGCGVRLQHRWINIDAFPREDCYYADFRDPLGLGGGSVRHIHCEHVLEHLEFDEAIRFLRECHRVLSDGGSLRLIIPDAEKYLRAYATQDHAFFNALRGLGGAAPTTRLSDGSN